MVKKKSITIQVNDALELIEKAWDSIDGRSLSILSNMWVEQNIKYNKKKEILQLFTNTKLTKNGELTLIKIHAELNNSEKITKSGVLKHLEYLSSCELLEASFVTTTKGRERLYRLSSLGNVVLKLCTISESWDLIKLKGNSI